MAQPSANKTQTNHNKTNQNSQNIGKSQPKEAGAQGLDEAKKQKSKTAARNVDPLIEDDDYLGDEGNKIDGNRKVSQDNVSNRSGDRH